MLCFKAQLPLRLLCYDLSFLSKRVTGDLCTPYSSIQTPYINVFLLLSPACVSFYK
jgi:hypothetical protein